MNDDELFERAATEQRRLQKQKLDDLIISGAKDAAGLFERSPETQERIALTAVARAVAEKEARQERKQPGPSRQPAPKVSKRKAVKAARKRNR